jgi:hypothetical protein
VGRLRLRIPTSFGDLPQIKPAITQDSFAGPSSQAHVPFKDPNGLI